MRIWVPELAQVLLPWWVLGAWLMPSWWWLWAPIGVYLLGTKAALAHAGGRSLRDGFRRVIRLPVSPWVLRCLLRGRRGRTLRVDVPQGIPCYLLHIRTEDLRDARRFRVELEADIRHGLRLGPAFYAGTTYSDVGRRVQRLAPVAPGAPAGPDLPEAVRVMPGTWFPVWLQGWGDVRTQQRRLAGRAVNRGVEWSVVCIETTGGEVLGETRSFPTTHDVSSAIDVWENAEPDA